MTQNWEEQLVHHGTSCCPQRDLDRLEKWAYQSPKKFNKGKCKALPLRRNNPQHQHRLGATQLESSLAEKDLGVLVDTRLDVNEPCALAAKKVNGILSCIRRSIASCGRRWSCTGECCVQVWALQYKRDMDVLERVQERAVKMIKGQEHLFPWGKAERAGTVQPGEEKAQGDLIHVYKYRMGGNEEDGARLFPVMPSARTRGSEHKLKHRRFSLNIRKRFFTVRVTEPRHRLPREVVESPSLEILKSHLDMVLGSWL